MNIQYFNCFWPLIEGKRNYKQHLNCNNDARNKLDNELSKLSETDPLFSKIEYAHIYNYPINEHGKYYLAEIEFIDFYDLTEKPLRRINFEVKKKTEIKKYNIINCPGLIIEVEVASSEKDAKRTLNHVVKKGTVENSNILKQYKEKGIRGLLIEELGLRGDSLLYKTSEPIISKTELAGGFGSLLGKLFK